MSRLYKAQQPILNDLATGLFAALLWFTPIDAKLGPLTIGIPVRLLGYAASLFYWTKAYLAAEELLQQAPLLLKKDEVDDEVEIDHYTHDRAAELEAATTHIDAAYLEAAMPAEEKIQRWQKATEIQQPALPEVAPVETKEAPSEVPEAPARSGNTLSVLIGTSGKQKHVWTPSEHGNGFFLVLGSSGSGKTETLKSIAAETHHFGIPVLIFDFHGDVVLEGATTYKISHASEFGINPMQLDSTDPDDGGVFAQVSLLLEQLQSSIPSIGHRQHQVLKQAIELAYQHQGITSDPQTWSKTAPTFATVLRILELLAENAEGPAKDSILGAHAAVAKIFEHPIFAKPKQVKLDALLKSSHRLDLSRLENDALRFLVVDTLLRKLTRALRAQGHIPVQPKSDRERYRLLTIIDEAKLVASRDRDNPNSTLNKCLTEYRKFGLGMGLGSQVAEHFSDEAKAQIACRLILKPFDRKQAATNAPDIGLSAEHLLLLKGRGDGWLKLGANDRPVRVQVTPLHERSLESPKPDRSSENDGPEDLWKQAIARLEADLQAKLPPAIDHPEVDPPDSASNASQPPANPEVDPPDAEAPEARNSSASESGELLPAEELTAALKRLCTLFKEVGSTEAVHEFAQLSIDDRERALWFGIKALGLTQRQAILKVFDRSGSGQKGFYEPASWLKALEEKFGTNQE
ncbi:ATP-binding protein [Leptolyngbya sp. FACHB-36]|uniref:ATP-binding protein n=1 Tax=Leptolyngbya sp. FACHB-36 TaxID=2692808 RepID=UPI0016816767|nr:helicase HerA-like domain-containing protein [Leptolyngbya sp. FACHB-36]MBD2018742.1 ATP-binding protein [Leptolyngbya sp. FACHB-36]